jgi:hypothetical protein
VRMPSRLLWANVRAASSFTDGKFGFGVLLAPDALVSTYQAIKRRLLARVLVVSAFH